MKTIERRTLSGKLTLRAAEPGSGSVGRLDGYAATFNSESHDLGGFREILQRGCFDSVLRTNPDVRALCNHDPNQVLGRTKNGTLRLQADPTGLFCSVDLPDTQTGRDLHTLVSRGDVSQMSFAFKLNDGDDDWSNAQDTNGPYVLRTVRNVSQLFDVSAVTYPAYENTKVVARNLRSDYVIATVPVIVPAELYVDGERIATARDDEQRRIQCFENGKKISADRRAEYDSAVEEFNKPGQKTPYHWQRKGK